MGRESPRDRRWPNQFPSPGIPGCSLSYVTTLEGHQFPCVVPRLSQDVAKCVRSWKEPATPFRLFSHESIPSSPRQRELSLSGYIVQWSLHSHLPGSPPVTVSAASQILALPCTLLLFLFLIMQNLTHRRIYETRVQVMKHNNNIHIIKPALTQRDRTLPTLVVLSLCSISVHPLASSEGLARIWNCVLIIPSPKQYSLVLVAFRVLSKWHFPLCDLLQVAWFTQHHVSEIHTGFCGYSWSSFIFTYI